MTDHHVDDDNTTTYRVYPAGTKVAQYLIVEKIGAGGMGEVYLAQDNKLNRPVALKFLPIQYVSDPECKARFMREAQSAARLSHPNIVTIYEVGEFEGRPFFAMEYIEGKSLHHFAHASPLSTERIIELIGQICEGLDKAHRMGIVHRDIKAANIMLDSDDRPKILDFGLATVQGGDKLTKDGSAVGTVAYMSPEQVQGKEIDQRSDLFSLGIVLYELVAGRTPFKRDSEGSTIQSILNELPEPVARYKAGVPEGLQRIIDKLLDKDPEMRYQTASDLRADLLREKRMSDSGVSSASQRAAVGNVASQKRSLKSIIISVSAVAAVLLLTLVLKPWSLELQTTEEARAGEDRLAVMYFDNFVDPSDSLRLGEIVTNLLITDLSDSPNLKVLSSQQLYGLLKQLGKEGERSIDRETAIQVARKANARWMLTGSILQIHPRTIITTQIIDVENGAVESSQRSTGEESEEIFAQVDRLTTAIKGDLAVSETAVDGNSRSLADVTTHSQEAYRLYLEGIELNNKLYRADAKKSFERAIELDSTFAMAYYQLASNWSGATEADEYVRKAVKYSDNTNRLQRLYILALADGLAKDIDAAIADLQQIINEYPEEKEAHVELASIYSMEKLDIESAIQHYQAALDIDPLDKTIYNNLAYAYKDLRRYDEALRYIDRYIALVPDEPNPYDSRGEIAAAAGDFELAVQSYQEALAKDPGFENALQALVGVYVYLGNYASADSCARALVADDKPEIRSFGRMVSAVLPAAQGRFAESRQALDVGIEADKAYPDPAKSAGMIMRKSVAKAMLFAEEEQFDSALAILETADTLGRRYFPDDPLQFQDLYAEVLARKGDVREAGNILRVLEPGVLNSKQNGTKADYLHARGFVAIYAGDYQTAIAVLSESLPLARRNKRPTGEYLLAQAYLGAGQPENAVPLLERQLSCLEDVFDRNPLQGVKTHYFLGQAYEQLGQTAKAIEQYDRFLSKWQGADPQLAIIADARERLERLRNPA